MLGMRGAGLVDAFVYSASNPNSSIGREHLSNNSTRFFASPTPGAPNPVAPALSKPVRIVKNLFPIDHSWHYRDTGTFTGTNWFSVDYDDGSWNSGPALFFIEPSNLPGPENTPLQPDPELNMNENYFRLVMSLPNGSE